MACVSRIESGCAFVGVLGRDLTNEKQLVAFENEILIQHADISTDNLGSLLAGRRLQGVASPWRTESMIHSFDVNELNRRASRGSTT